jgi:hypothetical protein
LRGCSAGTAVGISVAFKGDDAAVPAKPAAEREYDVLFAPETVKGRCTIVSELLIIFASSGATAIGIAGLGGGLPIFCRGMARDTDARTRRRRNTSLAELPVEVSREPEGEGLRCKSIL